MKTALNLLFIKIILGKVYISPRRQFFIENNNTSPKSFELFNEAMQSQINAIFNKDDPFPPIYYETLEKIIRKGYSTRLYFSRGKHNLVLPAWLLGLLGPEGKGRRGIAGLPLLINTDLRSYYALGSPDSEEEPVIDHRGGIIPIPGSYTLLFGTIIDGRPIYSSEKGEVSVELHEEGYPLVTVTWEIAGDILLFNVFADNEDDNEAMVINVVRGFSNHQLLISLCPIDQEGLTTVESLDYDNKHNILNVKDLPNIFISETPIQSIVTPLKDGHAGKLINSTKDISYSCTCEAKAASWVASFPVRANPDIVIPLDKDVVEYDLNNAPDGDDIEDKWEEILDEFPLISTSNEDVDFLYKTSGLVSRLLSDVKGETITIGPSLQEEMWLPSLVFQAKLLDRFGFYDIVKRVLDNILSKVDSNGLIAKGNQWDAQGALVQAVLHHYQYSGDKEWIGSKYSILKRIGDWVSRQIKKGDDAEGLVTGLLPPGTPSWFNPLYWEISYYYSNNFWSLSIFKNLAIIAKELGKHGDSEKFMNEFDHYKDSIENSVSQVCEETIFLPASPFMRDSSEMIFVLNAFYPLNLYNSTYQPIINSINHLWKNYVIDGGLLIDQPWNSYASYHSILLAQVTRYIDQTEKVEEIINFLISHTTNKQGWAEGISPQTSMGSVGDSPSGFAAAEFCNLIQDIFVEQYWEEAPVFLKGMPRSWLEKGVEAKRIRLFHGTLVDIKAKLDGNILSFEWNIENASTDLHPMLYLKNPKIISKDTRQISNFLFELSSNKGSVKVNYSQ